MAKPIFIIAIPAPIEHLAQLTARLERKLDDYHVLVIYGQETKFQVFSDKEIEPIELEELKKILNDNSVKCL